MRFAILAAMLLVSGCTKEYKYTIDEELQYDTLVSISPDNKVHIYHFPINEGAIPYEVYTIHR